MGQFSRFIQQGAVRIATTPVSVGKIENVAFENPDGSVVCLLSNAAGTARQISLSLGTRQWQVTVPAKSVTTVKWP